MALQRMMIGENSAGLRLDLFLTRSLLDDAGGIVRSRSEIQRLIGAGQVTLNGQRAKPSTRIKANDLVQVRELPPRQSELKPEALPLDILYEDTDCIVINKTAGIVVHPAAGRSSGTLVNALLHHCPDLSGIGGELRPGIVHRLDKDTSGVMIVAKNSFALQELVRQFKERSVNKEYLAVVWGKIAPDQGVIDRPIGRHRSDRKRMSSVHSSSKTRAAVTEWCVEKYFPIQDDAGGGRGVSLVRLKPRTGRTHQLRVHLGDMGYPLVGDKIYGIRKKIGGNKGSTEAYVNLFPRQALHAEKLRINHVRSGRPVEFVAPLAKDICDLLAYLSKRGVSPGTISRKMRS
jgi:23S rRNA pseudouridine1911/1915/1917 synthase